MSKRHPPLNPCSFSDALTEKYYAQKPAKREKLKRKREKLVAWLRKKAKSSRRAQALADKIEHVDESTGANPQRVLSVPTRRSVCSPRPHALSQGQVRRRLRHHRARGRHHQRGKSVMSNNTERFIRRTKEKLGRANVGVFIGAVDWSMNEHKEKKH